MLLHKGPFTQNILFLRKLKVKHLFYYLSAMFLYHCVLCEMLQKTIDDNKIFSIIYYNSTCLHRKPMWKHLLCERFDLILVSRWGLNRFPPHVAALNFTISFNKFILSQWLVSVWETLELMVFYQGKLLQTHQVLVSGLQDEDKRSASANTDVSGV